MISFRTGISSSIFYGSTARRLGFKRSGVWGHGCFGFRRDSVFLRQPCWILLSEAGVSTWLRLLLTSRRGNNHMSKVFGVIHRHKEEARIPAFFVSMQVTRADLARPSRRRVPCPYAERKPNAWDAGFHATIVQRLGLLRGLRATPARDSHGVTWIGGFLVPHRIAPRHSYSRPRLRCLFTFGAICASQKACFSLFRLGS